MKKHYILLILFFKLINLYSEKPKNMKLNKLTPEEKMVIIDKGTERPFTGEYNKNKREGVYVCKQCENPLYNSSDKFESNCGWPSFDDEIKGSVLRVPDVDGMRTEIICNNCKGHLGHIFLGEGFTNKNTRHCVNSISLKFIEKDKLQTEIAILGGGCFWCVEAIYQDLEGVIKVESGYSGGDKESTYNEVCQGNTGHAEVVKITYNPNKISYSDILEVFFQVHDPTSLNRQGEDIGTQYRSVIFYSNLEQKQKAEYFIKKLTEERIFDNKIVTEVSLLKKFYKAENYHENYYNLNRDSNYCRIVITPKLDKFRKIFKTKLKSK